MPDPTYPEILDLHARLSQKLCEIKSFFNTDLPVTLVVRTPHLDSGNLVIGDDDLDQVIQAIREFQEGKVEGAIRVDNRPQKDQP